MIVSFFIPSGSGQATVMMPLMTPLADLLGMSREVAVMAFHFGDGFSFESGLAFYVRDRLRHHVNSIGSLV